MIRCNPQQPPRPGPPRTASRPPAIRVGGSGGATAGDRVRGPTGPGLGACRNWAAPLLVIGVDDRVVVGQVSVWQGGTDFTQRIALPEPSTVPAYVAQCVSEGADEMRASREAEVGVRLAR